MIARYPEKKLTIVGGGIIGALEAYAEFLAAEGSLVKVTIFEKNASLDDTTTFNIVPSLTPDEMLSVIDRGELLFQKLMIRFDLAGGIRVDIDGVNESAIAEKFKADVLTYSQDEAGHLARTKALLGLGKYGMELWQKFFDASDDKLQAILRQANFQPCRNSNKSDDTKELHDGYRIDLIYDHPQAQAKAATMQQDYQSLGYHQCKPLTPAEVKKLDPQLTLFCDQHSNNNEWNDGTRAIWRPGGCIDTNIFLPLFYGYLTEKFGTYTNSDGKIKNCFQLKFSRKVNALEVQQDKIVGLGFFNREGVKRNKHEYSHSNYVFCPGEAVGTIKSLGLQEPSFAGFAGVSLLLNIPLTPAQCEEYGKFNHCMEVHKEGVVLAWQARFRNNKIFIGVAGTKAFYGNVAPTKHDAFAIDRNLLQLNMINDVLPHLISIALNRDTRGQKLTLEDMHLLEEKAVAARWAGIRCVAYDGFPSLGPIYKDDVKIANARVTTHLGSGGVSNAHSAIFASRMAIQPLSAIEPEVIKTVVGFSQSRRHM